MKSANTSVQGSEVSFQVKSVAESAVESAVAKTWADLGFFIEPTGDGSPSLRMFQSVDPAREHGEAMHHSGGAWAETDLIYGACVRRAFAEIPKPGFAVIGLGLGYIEMVIVKESLQAGKFISCLHSFESQEGLRELFVDWLHDKVLAEEVQRIYDQVLNYVIGHSGISSGEIKQILKTYFPRKDSIAGALNEESRIEPKAHVILYDAFSSKTSPELWDEEFLRRFIRNFAQPQAMVATYANKGNLKRALAAEGFVVQRNRGFSGKRNSTFAYRMG